MAVGIVGAGLGCKHLAWGAVISAAHTALSGDTLEELGLEGHALSVGFSFTGKVMVGTAGHCSTQT